MASSWKVLTLTLHEKAKLCMQKPTQEKFHFIVKYVKRVLEKIFTLKHTYRRECSSLTYVLKGVSKILCMKKSRKYPVPCQVCENSLRENLHIKKHTQERNISWQVWWKCLTQTLHKKATQGRVKFVVKFVKTV